MDKTIKSGPFGLGWLPYLVLLAVAVALWAAAVGTILVSASQPAKQAAPASFQIWTAADAVAAFHSAGLTAEVIRGATREERDGLSTIMVVDTRRFRLSADDREMGMVLSFANRRDLARMQKYFLALDHTLPQFHSWVFVQDNILVQLNGDIPESTAHRYWAALRSLDVR